MKAMNKGEGTGQELNLGNCMWFMTASFLQQGPDYTPRGAGGRVLSASFWFFCIIIVSTYTANLAAFFTSKLQIRFSVYNCMYWVFSIHWYTWTLLSVGYAKAKLPKTIFTATLSPNTPR